MIFLSSLPSQTVVGAFYSLFDGGVTLCCLTVSQISLFSQFDVNSLELRTWCGLDQRFGVWMAAEDPAGVLSCPAVMAQTKLGTQLTLPGWGFCFSQDEFDKSVIVGLIQY